MVETNDKQLSQKRRVHSMLAFVLPFLFCGAAATYWSYGQGQKDIERWSHLTAPTPVPLNELVFQFLFWFVGAGFIAGLVGLLLYRIFTRAHSY
ncbi:MAG: hypothetical protein HYX67_02760 [Candidatus Melainabacteria bacterium]|nr:hypothetical protein [Candidatus Melainabacteria bacterium]